jgi:hypothetical protein
LGNVVSSVGQVLTLAIVSFGRMVEYTSEYVFVLTFGSGTVIALLFLLYLLRHLVWLNLRLSEFRSALLGDISRLGILLLFSNSLR